MTIDKSFPDIAEGDQQEFCPFLGLAQDSQTSLSYPSSWNVCHHTRPVGTPNLNFQKSFCFSRNHSTCPVYSRSERAPLPAGIRFPVGRIPAQKRLTLTLLIGAVVLILGVVGAVWEIQDRHNHNGSLSANLPSSTPTATQSVLPTGTLPFTDTPNPLTLTAVPTQTLTNSPTGPTTRPTDTRWPTLTPTLTPTASPTRTPTSLPSATATFLPTWTPRPTDTHWVVFTLTGTR